MAEYYMKVGGGGLQNGSDWDNAWDWDDAWHTTLAAGDLLNVGGGTYTETADKTLSNSGGGAAGHICVVGWNAALTGVATSWDDCPVLGGDYNAGGKNYHFLHGLKFVGGARVQGNTFITCHGIWVDSATAGDAFTLGANCFAVACRANASSSSGFSPGQETVMLFCEAYDNATWGITRDFFLFAALCYTHDNGASHGGIDSGGWVLEGFYNTITNEVTGLAASRDCLLIASILDSCTNGTTTGTNFSLSGMNNFNGNTADHGTAPDNEFDKLTEAPGFTDLDTNDYTVSAAALLARQSFITPESLNIGAWQGGAGGGGGGGGGGAFPHFGRGNPFGTKI
jgi:hypothetical protein